LVEIGGGFRVPDVMSQSGARLVEVGTTNRVHLSDYEQALGEKPALFLRAHRSNFRILGFTGEPGLEEIAALAHVGVVAFVQRRMLLPLRGRLGPVNCRVPQDGRDHLAVVTIRSGKGLAQRNPISIDMVVPLRAQLGPIGGVLPCQIPPFTGAWTVTLSTACHSQSIPWISSYFLQTTTP
jgi:hypothetical protein